MCVCVSVCLRVCVCVDSLRVLGAEPVSLGRPWSSNATAEDADLPSLFDYAHPRTGVHVVWDKRIIVVIPLWSASDYSFV